MASAPLNQFVVLARDPNDATNQSCEWVNLPGISPDAGNAIGVDANGFLFSAQVSPTQEFFGASETLPATATNSVVVTLSDGTTQVVNAGDTIPANIVGCIAVDEVSNKATYIAFDTNTSGTVEAATAAGTTTNGVPFSIGDFIVSFPDGTTYIAPSGTADTFATQSDPTADDGFNRITFADTSTLDVVTDVCQALGDVPATPTQLCYTV